MFYFQPSANNSGWSVKGVRGLGAAGDGQWGNVGGHVRCGVQDGEFRLVSRLGMLLSGAGGDPEGLTDKRSMCHNEVQQLLALSECFACRGAFATSALLVLAVNNVGLQIGVV